MASNIDDELLALAGGGESSSDGEGAAVAASSRGASSKAKRNQRKVAAQDSSDEDAEGNSDDDDEDSGPLYPYDGSYKDYEDKMRIEALPLIERESILATRRDEILSRERARQLRGMVAAQQGRKDASSKKRKAPSAKKAKSTRKKQARADSDMDEETDDEDEEDEDDDEEEEDEDDDDRAARSSGRARKTVGQSETRNKTLQELSANRRKRAAGKAKSARHRDADESRRRGRRSSSDSEDEESEESEGYLGSDTEAKRTSGRQGRSRREEGPFVAPDLEDVNKARIGREDILKVMYRKGWEDKLIGNFVRVVADAQRDERTGKTVQRYRAYEIVGWKTGSKWYQVDTGKYTRVKLELRFAREKHEKQILFVSNSDITAEEFQRYELQARESPQRPSKRQVLEQADDWEDFVNEPWSEEVFTAVVKARKAAKQEAEAARGGLTNGNGNGKPSPLQRAQQPTNGVGGAAAASADAPKGEDVLLAELNERNRRSDRERILEAERRQAENRRLAAKAALARGSAAAGVNSGIVSGSSTPMSQLGEGAGVKKPSVVDVEIDLGDF
ncbi:hypothetical protein BCV69DRAFT_283601 [Microstroma glucosiphilum]|uniref:Plus3 domain-containing protein n=1 Tax=Pseudomicrostroma glucosiphilum TaxID=1684307 RepID=A0A316U468_9BASI|nr:hypothetical protein BCV69DRAFT_283601 [Pseudomicrostroma glucosiphilum]PWN20069.1 hypothetical protein BCV69DRAFT_283601 [Pseudomicrostroma glucosiphilum]